MGGVTSVQKHKICHYQPLWSSKKAKIQFEKVEIKRFLNSSLLAIISRYQGWQSSALNMYWISLKVKNGQKPASGNLPLSQTILAPQVLT